MPNARELPPTRYRVLVVEDDPAIRRLIGKLLERKGVSVDIALDGNAAMSKLRENDYNAVVLDLMMPEVTGFQLIEFIKSTGKRTPVAVVSAVSQQALTDLDLDIVKVVISKPFDVDEFIKAIITLCTDEP